MSFGNKRGKKDADINADQEEGPALRRPHVAGYQIVEGHSLEGAAAALLATCMDKRIDMYG